MRFFSMGGIHVGVCAVLLLSGTSGCNTTEGALLGAGLGAGTGALAGSLSGKAGRGTAIGAGAGAVIGGIMGYQQEQMENRLKALEAQQSGANPPNYPVGGTGPGPVDQPGYYPQTYRPQGSVMPAEQPQLEEPTTANPVSTVVHCPNCSQALDVSDFRRGSKVRCPACNETFVY